MSRRRRAVKRDLHPDFKYNNTIVAHFINAIMRSGKKSLAQRILYDALDQVSKRTSQDAMVVFKKALNNVKPAVEVKSKRIGGANYQIPVEVSPSRKTTLAIRWLIESAKERREKNMTEKLANEIIAANNFEGNSIKKKEDTHRMAEANKAFAHFRWK
jgi:small subunit ribosomal protein S7